MKLKNKLLLGAVSLFTLAFSSGCSSHEDALIIKILNCEDYIGESEFEFTYLNDQGEEVTATYDDVLSGFSEYESEKLGKKVKVIYDTYDTNETMLSSLKTGKTQYDLIAASDYAIQKMMMMGMLQKIDRSRLDNYNAYCSRFLLDQMESITAEVPLADGKTSIEKMADYSVGYMWGTLGILFNPAKVASDKGLDEETVKFDMQSWHSLWDVKYKGEMSVKDSMRDTYSVGIMERFGEEIENALVDSGCFELESGSYVLKEGAYTRALETYSAPILTEIFNRCDEGSVKEVQATLLNLKDNIFGFEVDSGKDDIVKGLIGMNLAWSGDAVYSMNRGENESEQIIYYSVPKTGGNIWFDSWAIPATSDAEHKAVAEDFLNFVSDPQVAAANMDTIGYTSFIAGDTVHNLVRQWYDPRAYAMFVYHEADWWEDSDFIYAEYDEEGEIIPDGYSYNEEGLRYQDGKEHAGENDDYGYFDMTGSTYDEACVDGQKMSWEDYQTLYNEVVEEEAKEEGLNGEELAAYMDENGIAWDVVDLTYMFEGTLDIDDESLGGTPDANPYLFYTDEYETIEDEESGESVTLGRQFYAQYPDMKMIPKLAVMRDYGANNKYVLSMWSEVKSNALTPGAATIFIVIIGVAAVIVAASLISNSIFHSAKKARHKEEEASKR